MFGAVKSIPIAYTRGYMMQEAEVSLRVALYYIRNGLTEKDVTVSIDGAHIKTGDVVVCLTDGRKLFVNGHYSDDPLEDSLFRDDELQLQEEMDEEIHQYELEHGTDRKGSVCGRF